MNRFTGSAAVLLALGSLALGCEGQSSQPAPAYPSSYAPPPASYSSSYAPPYGYAPPARTPPPVQPVPEADSLQFNEIGENPPPAPQGPPAATPAPNGPPCVNVAPPAPREYGYGATAPQPEPPPRPPDARTMSAQAIAQATQQIDRLRRLESANRGARDDVDAALSDLENRRQAVLQDLRELEIEPRTRQGAARQELDRDVRALQDAVRQSYAIIAPPDQGLPPPAPLAPSSLP